MELPLYQCHKQVRAAMIVEMPPKEHYLPGSTVVLGLGDPSGVKIAEVVVDFGWLTRNPQTAVGGYFVEYQDGDHYTAFSPTRPFEGGYSLISEREAPPVDNAYVAVGCEQFGTVQPAPAPLAPFMRAKMQVSSVVTHEGGTETAKMHAVCKGTYPADGSDEDNSFARWTPSAALEMHIANPALFGKIKSGKKIYLDFTEAPE